MRQRLSDLYRQPTPWLWATAIPDSLLAYPARGSSTATLVNPSHPPASMSQLRETFFPISTRAISSREAERLDYEDEGGL